VRNRHNAASDSNWGDQEIYALMTARANEVLSVIGLIEAIDTSITTVSGTQGYAFPTNVVFVKKVLYNNYLVQQVDLRQADTVKEGNQWPSGRPEMCFEWNKTLYFVPIPDSAVTITLYVEKEHPYINNTTQTTLDLPSVLHFRMLDGVIGDMFSKDLNMPMVQHFETLWNQKHIPAFYEYRNQLKSRGKIEVLTDCDSDVSGLHGIY